MDPRPLHKMTPPENQLESSASSVTREGSLTLFGFPSTSVRVRGIPRSRRWRAVRAGLFGAGGLFLAPAVGMIPPHAPWAAGSLGLGLFLGLRKWRERFTVLSMDATCPKCGARVALEEGSALRPGTTVPCESCHHDPVLRLEGYED